MSARRLLLIDSDDNFFRVLHEQVSPYGFEIYRVEENQDALAYVKDLAPEVIFIAVEEPDKVGYSLCNKAKKGVAQDIPVVLTTSSVPPSGFHSHRKLKVHADEYIDKRTMSTEELVGKMDALVNLSGEAMEEMSFDDVEEFEMSVEEESYGDDDRTRVAPPQMLGDLDLDSDAAVAALTGGSGEISLDDDVASSAGVPEQQGEVQSSGVPEPVQDISGEVQPAVADYEPEPFLELEPEEPAAQPAQRAPRPRTSPIQPAPPPAPAAPPPAAAAPPPAPAAPPPAAASQSGPAKDSGIDLGLDQVADMATEEKSGGQSDSQHAQLLERLQAAERDNERLKAELDKARQGADSGSGSTFSRERELLSLREQLNKKERELLDLRDELGSKERQILEGKEEVSQLYRAKTALDSKNLELEQRLLELGEKLESMEGESAGASGRAQELEARVQELETKLGEAEARAQSEAEARATEKQQLGEEHARALEELKSKHAEELSQASQQGEEHKQAAASAVREEYEAKLAALGKEHEEALERLKAEHSEALAAAKESQTQELSAREEEHKRALEEAAARHAEELERVRREHDEALEAEKGKAKEEVERAASEAASKQSEKDELERAHAAALAELERERDELKAGLESARQKAQELESKLAERESSTQAHEAELAKRDERIAALELDIKQFETHNATYQEQVLEAYKKIKSNEARLDKAKRALAIALTLLDEELSTADEAAAPSGDQPS